MTKKIHENQLNFHWDSCFKDYFLEWFYDEGSNNPFICDDFILLEDEDDKDDVPRIEFDFYKPNGKKNTAVFYNKKIFDIEYEQLDNVISDYKEVSYFIEDNENFGFPCKWYESIFPDAKYEGFQEFFKNLETFKKMPYLELPDPVIKNCERLAKRLKEVALTIALESKEYETLSGWQIIAHDELKYGTSFHPYMFQLLPKLAKEAKKFKDDKTLYDKIDKIRDKEAFIGIQNLNYDNEE